MYFSLKFGSNSFDGFRENEFYRRTIADDGSTTYDGETTISSVVQWRKAELKWSGDMVDM